MVLVPSSLCSPLAKAGGFLNIYIYATYIYTQKAKFKSHRRAPVKILPPHPPASQFPQHSHCYQLSKNISASVFCAPPPAPYKQEHPQPCCSAPCSCSFGFRDTARGGCVEDESLLQQACTTPHSAHPLDAHLGCCPPSAFRGTAAVNRAGQQQFARVNSGDHRVLLGGCESVTS